jgi:hypothetical protein
VNDRLGKEAVMNASHRIARLVSASLIAGALAAPAAGARPAGPDPPSTSEPVVIEPAPPVVQGIDDGFDWASAAIGAGAAGGLVLLIGVGGSTYRQRHRHAGASRQV